VAAIQHHPVDCTALDVSDPVSGVEFLDNPELDNQQVRQVESKRT